MVTLDNPYSGNGMWLRGNLHTHTTNSPDGLLEPARMAKEYAVRGYDFLAVSDHDAFTPTSAYERDAITGIPAVEISSNGSHLLHLGTSEAVPPSEDRQEVLNSIDPENEYGVIAHPKWKHTYDHWPLSELERLGGYSGIEIYNGLIEGHPGSETAIDIWDQLLSSGRRVWGFANDDSHRPWEIAKGWNVVQAEECNATAILEALASGRFYASTGVSVGSIEVSDGTVSIDTENAEAIRLISDHGIIQQVADGSNASFRIPEQLVHRGRETSYIRIECDGRGTDKAWLQPIFLT